MSKGSELIDLISSKVLVLRGQRVMLDRDLAELYEVETKILLQAVKRNKERFPKDFMICLNWKEVERSRSQFVTLNRGSNVKYRPYVFTEQGVAMLSSVLKSRKAIAVNVEIMRAFVKLKKLESSNQLIRDKLDTLEKRADKHDQGMQSIFEAIRTLIAAEEKPKKRIGFHSKSQTVALNSKE